MPRLAGTSKDPLRQIVYRGTLVSEYTIYDLTQSSNPFYMRAALGEAIMRGLWENAFQLADSVSKQGLYHSGVIEADIQTVSSRMYNVLGIDLCCVLAVRKLRAETLAIDELEYSRKQTADRIMYELRELLSRSINTYIRAVDNTMTPLEVLRKDRPARKFEIVRREKWEDT